MPSSTLPTIPSPSITHSPADRSARRRHVPLRRRLRRSTCVCCYLALGISWSLTWSAADDPPAKSDPDYSAELPKIAPKSPAESIKAMQFKAGFHAELVAAEPLIRSPMALDFDEFGRAYVVELPEYNQYASEKPHGTGAIKRLEDTDGDGRFDTATVFVDNLSYPTAVACWNGGILVGVAPDLLFCQDTDGDGRADVRQTLFTGFGQDKAGEGMLNSIRWRIDNRFHIPCGLDGGEIVPALTAPQAAAPGSRPAPPINVRGQHLLLEPRAMALEATSGGGQHGMSLDDWNLRSFVCGNSEPVHLVMYDGRYLARNPYVQAPAAAVNTAPDGKFTKLMRISGVEPWRALRTRLRSKGVIPGSDEGGAPSGFFTGATGITVYRGDAWPSEFRGQLFVGEVSNNLIYRARLEPSGVGLTAHRADPDAEFMASSDNWFRPVQFANAPDGTLYVLDMYRELIEGAAFLAPQILKHMDPSAGADKGRIYRIAPDGFRPRPAPRLGDLATRELVALYEHANGWHRDTASRLIYERQNQEAVAPLQQLAANSPFPLARAMALFSLQGLRALQPEMVIAALREGDPRLREQALRLAESFPDRPDVLAAVLPLAGDPELRVRYQAAFTLGGFAGDAVTAALAKLAVVDGGDSWMQLAILSSIGLRRGPFLAALMRDRDTRNAPHVRAMLGAVAAQMGAAGLRRDLTLLLRQVEQLPDADEDQALALTLVRNLVDRQPVVRDLLQDAAGRKVQSIIDGLIRDARLLAQDQQRSPADRAAAVRTLAASEFDEVRPLFAELLQSRVPQPVQGAVLETLARFNHPEVPSTILEGWSSLTPQLRATSIETLFTRPAWIATFLDAVEQMRIARGDLDPARIALLQKHADLQIRERAQQLFAGAGLARRQEVVDAYQSALELSGDVERGRAQFRKVCSACHKLEGFGESIGADLNAIRDRGTAAVLLNILDPNREVKPQFLSYVVELDSGRTVTGMIAAETATSLTIRKPDNTTETILRVNIEAITSTGLSFMPEGLEKQLDEAAMADVLAYLNSIK
ncbi:MAG: PVC-type heme-binding CxxCH protein [Planctomycetales bacterium]